MAAIHFGAIIFCDITIKTFSLCIELITKPSSSSSNTKGGFYTSDKSCAICFGGKKLTSEGSCSLTGLARAISLIMQHCGMYSTKLTMLRKV